MTAPQLLPDLQAVDQEGQTLPPTGQPHHWIPACMPRHAIINMCCTVKRNINLRYTNTYSPKPSECLETTMQAHPMQTSYILDSKQEVQQSDSGINTHADN